MTVLFITEEVPLQYATSSLGKRSSAVQLSAEMLLTERLCEYIHVFYFVQYPTSLMFLYFA